MTIFIDTTQTTEVIIGLFIDGKMHLEKKAVERKSSQVALPLIVALLGKYKKTINDITDISVNLGPGSFTGVRVGVSIANALSYGMKVPVNGGERLVEPMYA